MNNMLIEKYEINRFLNPAFSAFLISIFLKEFSNKNNSGIEPLYLLLILPFSIHPKFRHLLNESKNRNLLLIIEKNTELFDNFDKVFTYFLSYTYEGLYFLLKAKVITISDEKLVFNPKKFKPHHYKKYIKNEVKAAKKLSLLLANKFDVFTVFKSLGIEL